ncbi:MAG: hypothetical protein H0X64_01100 [Gemmatimonadaceae bacterium]|nr:hypothetical protein [Gemmatimonadaceae bacterium]
MRQAVAVGFEAFITVDRGIAFQQQVETLPFGVVALRAPSNDIVDLRPLMPGVMTALVKLVPGQFIRVP